MVVETILLAIVGMGGVFSGLTLLCLCLVYMPQALDRMGYGPKDDEVKPAADKPTDPPEDVETAAVAVMESEPSEAEETEEPEQPDASSAAGGPASPWRLAEGAFSGPTTAQWVKPAFRAAFKGGGTPAPSVPAEIIVGGKPFEVSLVRMEGSKARAIVNGRELMLDLGELPEDLTPAFRAPVVAAPAPPPPRRKPRKARKPAGGASKSAPASKAAPKAAPAPKPVSAPGGTVPVVAPIPGTVKSIAVGAGEIVKRGQLVVLLEAMKMDNEIAAPVAGKIREVLVGVKDPVKQGDILLLIEPE
jgi:biotin carboxyl carrier protein/Na+-transporting methylmalonyl-CoA/oxaloacetate decarboxylase gamma subunit